ncbi:head-tail adaptor protein [Methylobacterium trifolii]|uniref:Head-tail adaptor protein n=1 Tax=Methylobacterium trifolii TaxID=1003092 RepID=A0ABQ4TYZ5_9HYPH|nr:head-tail adaptor protein [Methylobacterium trifolii]GJE59764.1 hypothetical protein MPOCJGCO_1866 [Methylobacterium trifolii]
MAIPNPRPPLGARRRRFVLELPIDEPDGFGGSLRRYVAGPVLWGAISPVGEVERLRGGRADVAASHRITLRARAGLSAAMRLSAGPRRFAIRTVSDPDERGRDSVCHVEELFPAPPAPEPLP